MNILLLPDPSLVRGIFLLLPGGSLHSCRQVCKSWNNFIMENIWNSSFARKQLENQLEKNWKTNSFVETSEIIDVGVNTSRVIAASGDYIVIKSGAEEPKVIVINVITKDKWIFEDVGDVTAENSTTKAVVNNKIVALWSVPVYEDGTTLIVCSLKTKEVLFRENLSNYLNVVLVDSSSTMLVLLFQDKIDVLSFNDEGSMLVSRTSCPVNHQDTTRFINYAPPYILHCTWSALNVWKIDYERKQVELHKHVPDFEIFFRKANGEALHFHHNPPLNATYVASHFIVVNATEIDYDDDMYWAYDEEDMPGYMCVLLILNEDGERIREIQVNAFRFKDVDTKLHVLGNQLLVEADEGCKMFKFYIPEVLNPDPNQAITCHELPELQHLPELQQEYFDDIYFFNKTSIASVKHYHGSNNIKVRSFNFWATN